MRPNKARFVTVCQQLLAIGVVLAVLGPAADVVSLDVVTRPGTAVDATAEQPTLTRLPGTPADRRDDERDETSRVETAPVEPVVTEVPLQTEEATAEASGQGTGDAPRADREAGEREFVSAPEKVRGYGAVGVTWSPKDKVEDDDITVLARTRKDGAWSGWTAVEYHDEHGPDPDSAEGRHARPGTDPLIVGDVDEVQTKVITADGTRADDLQMSIVEPGTGRGTEVEPAAIDTATLEGGKGESDEGLPTSEGDIALQAGSYTQKPRIYSRAQWGANERMRDAGSLNYYEVHAGFVHHTVNANAYTRDQVPGIIRSIYAYHTQTRGWSDIGYNFLVDRFGRIWEGRYGGVDRPVVGAHTLGYNDYAFAMSAIGNFETAQPTSAMLQAYGRLFAWKLSLHGIDAASTRQKVGRDTFQAINGHRDAGSTACPGRYLYAKIPTIRTLAAQTQADWSGRERTTDMVASTYPDIVVRRTSDQAAFVVPTGGLLRLKPGRVTGTGWDRYDVAVASPDLTGDRRADMLVRRAGTGTAGVRPGRGGATYAGIVTRTALFTGFDQIAAAGDLNGDGHNDIVGRYPSTGRLYLFRGDSAGGFTRVLLSEKWAGYDLTAATGDVNGDGRADVLARTGNALWLHPGNGRGALGAPTKLAGSWAAFDVITGYGDFTADGRNDLLVRSRTSGTAHVVPGRGRGTFGHWLGPLSEARGLGSVTAVQALGTRAADVLGIRGADLVTAEHTGRQHTLPPVSAGTRFANTNALLSVGDWDRDGPADVITRENWTGNVFLHRGLGSGRFAAPQKIGTGFAGVRLLSAVGDTTGDGWPDLMGQPRGGSMRIYPGRGVSGFKPSYVAHSAVTASRQLGLGRWNSDGAPDNAFVHRGALSWLAGNGPGGLTGGKTSVSVSLTGYNWVLSVGDVDGNGRPDLVVREATTGYLWLLRATGSGFGSRRFLAEGFSGFDLAG